LINGRVGPGPKALAPHAVSPPPLFR